MAVFVLDMNKNPLDPCCEARARKLLGKGKAAVFRARPFTIIMKSRKVEDSVVKEHRIKIDPGSKVTGIAVIKENEENPRIVFAAELEHKGDLVCNRLRERAGHRRFRRCRKTRYRQRRYLNRASSRRKGRLYPSALSRVSNVVTWVNRLRRFCPVSAISMELVKFDLQKQENPEISGVEYQQGTLFEYEVKEYLLEKWGRRCTYCGREGVPLQKEHILARANGGTNRVSNLCLACERCNNKKGKRPIQEFLKKKPALLKKILAQAKAPLKDAAAVNVTRWALFRRLKETGLPVECGSGGRTKWNRTRLGLGKSHWADAACVGKSVPGGGFGSFPETALKIKAMGRGTRQLVRTDRYGFPICHRLIKTCDGFRSGDLVKVMIPNGKYAGVHVGRIVIQGERRRLGIGKAWFRSSWAKVVQRADGYQVTSESVI